MRDIGTTLFLGNGLNQVRASTFSWPHVLSALAQSCGRPDLARPTSTKPFTLLFEEMVLCSPESGDREDALKTYVASLVRQIAPFGMHQRLRGLPVRHILTTNYDYAIERADSFGFIPAHLSSESRYSLFRRHHSANQFVWHIHGEADRPATIVLGHDQYVGYLTKTKNYLTPSSYRERIGDHHRSPLISGIADFESGAQPYSWVDLFIRDNIHMVGFGLDYTEIGIWWLITYKARLRAQNPRTPKGVTVGQTTYYFIHPHRITGRDRGRLAMLRSMGVHVHEVDAGPKYGDALDAYERAVTLIERAF
jgi:hypothetical protein